MDWWHVRRVTPPSVASLLLHLSYLHNHRLSVTETSHIHWTFNTLSNNGFKDPIWVWCALMKGKYHTLGWHYSVGKIHGHCLQHFFFFFWVVSYKMHKTQVWLYGQWRLENGNYEKKIQWKNFLVWQEFPTQSRLGSKSQFSLFLPPVLGFRKKPKPLSIMQENYCKSISEILFFAFLAGFPQ